MQSFLQAMFGQCPTMAPIPTPAVSSNPDLVSSQVADRPVTSQPGAFSSVSSLREVALSEEDVHEEDYDYSLLRDSPSGLVSQEEEEEGDDEAYVGQHVVGDKFRMERVDPILDSVAETSVLGVEPEVETSEGCSLSFGRMELPQPFRHAHLKVPQEVRLQTERAVQALTGSVSKWKPFSAKDRPTKAFRVTQEDFDEFFAVSLLDEEVKSLFSAKDKVKSTGFDPDWERILLDFDSHMKVMLRFGVFQLHILNAMGIDMTPSDSASEEEKAEADSSDGNLACVGLLADMSGHQVKGCAAMLAQLSKLRRENVCRGLGAMKFKSEFVDELRKVPSPAKALFGGRLDSIRKSAAKKIAAAKETVATLKQPSRVRSFRGQSSSTRGQRSFRARGASTSRGRQAPPKRKATGDGGPSNSQRARGSRGRSYRARGRGRGQRRI